MIHPGRPFQPGQSGNPAGRVDGRRYRSIVDNLSAEVRRRTGRAPGAGALCIIGEVAVLASSRKGDRVRAARAIADLLGRLGLDLKPEPTKPPSLDEYLRRRRKAAGASVALCEVLISCGVIHTRFGEILTPFGELPMPFGNVMTPFGNLMTPLGDFLLPLGIIGR